MTFWSGALPDGSCDWWWACLPPSVNFYLCYAPSIGGPPKPVQLVNEVEDPGGMTGTFWPQEGMSVCERSLTVWRLCCSIHAGSGLCHCDGSVVECHGVPFSVVEAALHCLWTSGGQSKIFGEWVSLSNRIVLLWVCLPSGPLMHTSGFSLPAVDMVKWAWMESLYLVDVFHRYLCSSAWSHPNCH